MKFVLEGHERGVNWAAFHPSGKPFIISSSDDRTVRVWRYNEARAWETDVIRGHQNNISAAIFHTYNPELIVSVGEDKTMRFTEYTKRSATPEVNKRNNDRFWAIASHPTSNLLVAGHDSGLIVFKLSHERPAYCLFEDQLFLLRDRMLLSSNLVHTNEGLVLGSEEQRASLPIDYILPPAIMQYSAADDTILLSTLEKYVISQAKGDPKTGDSSGGTIIVGRNRMVSVDTNGLTTRALDNTVVRKSSVQSGTVRIIPAGIGRILCVPKSSSVVHLYDVTTDQMLATYSCPSGLKYSAISPDGRIALYGRRSIAILPAFNQSSNSAGNLIKAITIESSVNVKSAVWDGPLLFVTDSNHLKYILPNGEPGIICTIQAPLYLAAVHGDTVIAVDRNIVAHVFRIDPTDFRFRLALLAGDRTVVAQMLAEADLVGQSIIAYLQRSGFPEVALAFVRDPVARLPLAIQAADMEAAIGAAKKITTRGAFSERQLAAMWESLGEEALMLGNFEIALVAFDKGGIKHRANFLRLLLGMEEDDSIECKVSGEELLRSALFKGDRQMLAEQLSKNGEKRLESLTLACNDGAARYLGINGEPVLPISTIILNKWPMTATKSQPLADFTHVEITQAKIEHTPSALISEEVGWDVEDIDESEVYQDFSDQNSDSVVEKIGEDKSTSADITTEDGILPEAGLKKEASLDESCNYERLVSALYQRFGIINFEPLEELVYARSLSKKVLFPRLDNTIVCIERNNTATLVNPISSHTYEPLIGDAMRLVSGGKFSEARELLKKTLYLIIFDSACNVDSLKVPSSESFDIDWQMVEKCRTYLLGLGMELLRKQISADDPKKALVLACRFASLSGLEAEHSALALRSAQTQAYRLQCYTTAASLARQHLALSPAKSLAAVSRKIISAAERLPLSHQDAVNIELGSTYDHLTFEILNDPPVHCLFCQAAYEAAFAGQRCSICQIALVDSPQDVY